MLALYIFVTDIFYLIYTRGPVRSMSIPITCQKQLSNHKPPPTHGNCYTLSDGGPLFFTLLSDMANSDQHELQGSLEEQERGEVGESWRRREADGGCRR